MGYVKTEAAPRFDKRATALREAMADIVRLAVLRLPPFSSLGVASCITPFDRVLRRRSEMLQQIAREAFVSYMEFIVSDHVRVDQRALQTWDEIDAEFQSEFAANYVPLDLPLMQISVKESKQIIREVCEGLDGFTYEKAKSGVITFSRSAPGVGRVVLEFDLGSQGAGSFDVYVGTREPDYSVELAKLLCLPSRTWRYARPEECRRAVLEACLLIRTLMPVLDQKLQQLNVLS